MSEILPTYSNTDVLDYDTNTSVKKYQFDNLGVTKDIAQQIHEGYFDATEFSHSIAIEWDIKTYIWDYDDDTPDVAILELYNDISDKVIDVNYNCTSDSDIKTSASLTMLVPMDDDYWYMNRTYDVRENRSNGTTGEDSVIWIPQVYCIIERITDNVNPIYERNLGFFIPDSSAYSYDSTTSKLTIQLQNLSYQFTAEGGGTIVTALRSYNYLYDMPYNHNPTKIIAYKLDSQSDYKNSLEKMQTQNEYADDKAYLMNQQAKILETIPAKAHKYGTAEILYRDAQSESYIRTINTPLPLSFSGYTNGTFTRWDGNLMTMRIYSVAMSYLDVILNNYRLPLVGYKVPYEDSEWTAKSDIFPLGWDFDNGTDVFTVAKTMLSDRYYDPCLWIDEDRNMCVSTIPTFPNAWRQCVYYRDYSELIISEDISINENGVYTAVEVFGKDNEYYGICDATLDGFKLIINPDDTAKWLNEMMSYISIIPKTKTIQSDSAESDFDCFNLAAYELWKSSCNNVTISIKVRDNGIYNFNAMSHIVGETFFEYKLNQGNGKTIRCLLTKASLSNGIWDFELKPFQSFALSYDWYDTKVYHQFTTKYYNQFLAAEWNTEQVDWFNGQTTDYITQLQKHRLSQPVILAYQMLDNNILRLYISAIDIGLAVVKMWKMDANGAYNDGFFVGESVDTNGTDELPWGTPHAESIADIEDGNHIYKVFDYQIDQSGKYSFCCQLYNIFYESSLGSNSVVLDITSQNKIYLVNEVAQKLTTENNERLTI